MPDVLLKADVAEVPLKACRNIYQAAYGDIQIKGLPEGITSELMCAKISFSTVNTCLHHGDSGTGLKLNFKKKDYIIGITSFGIDCGSSFPFFYTRVSEYIDWIEEIVSS